MIYESDKLKEINTGSLREESAEAYEYALKTKNLKERFKQFQEAQILEKIAKEIEKWELFVKGY